MAKPRWREFHEWEPLIVHTVSRCVRRQPILEEPERRDWLEDRLTVLAGAFAIDVLEWAAMTNHLHLGLRTHPHLAMAWSAEEVARRWLTICPNWTIKRVIGLEDPAPTSMEIELAVEDRSLICDWRRRLYDLGWFHKLLKEPCARLWNLQDQVSGHFWQERYFCLPCRSEDQWKATAAYIVLNPVRAGAADELDGCRYSSITRRLTQLEDELRRGLHANDRTAHERVLLAPAIACERGSEVATMSDAEFSRRVDRFMATLTRRDHAIADAHKAKLDAERFEHPAPMAEAEENSLHRAMRRVAATRMRVESGPRLALGEATQHQTETAPASSATPTTSTPLPGAPEPEPKQHPESEHQPKPRPGSERGPESHATPEADARPESDRHHEEAHRDDRARTASKVADHADWEAARVRRLFRTRAQPRPRMPDRDPNVNSRPPRRTNHWSRTPWLTVLAGLTLTAFIEYVDATGRAATHPGKSTIRSDAPRATEKLRAKVEAEAAWSARDGPPG